MSPPSCVPYRLGALARNAFTHDAHELLIRNVLRDRRLAREHPEHEQADLIEIALLARVAARDDFGRHDLVMHDVRPHGGRAAELVADSEVADLHRRAIDAVNDENVSGVQIVVDDVVVVEELHGGEELARELDDEPLLHRRADHVGERVLALLECHEEQVILLERVVHVDDVRVTERHEPLRLLRPLAVHLLVRAVRGADHFDGVDLIERTETVVDGAELARAEDAPHFVFSALRDEPRPDLREPNDEPLRSWCGLRDGLDGLHRRRQCGLRDGRDRNVRLRACRRERSARTRVRGIRRLRLRNGCAHRGRLTPERSRRRWLRRRANRHRPWTIPR